MGTGINDEVELARYSHQTQTAAGIIQEIRQFEQRMATLRTNLNQLAAFSCIPDDILLDIFFQFVSEACAEHWTDASRWGEDEPYDQWLKSLPLVCKRWNTLVINSPRLWSCITLAPNTNCVLKAIKLSANAMLHLRANGNVFSDGQSDSAFIKMLQQLPRTHTLELKDLDDVSNQPTPEDVGVAIAPVLKTVRLKRTGHFEEGARSLLKVFQQLSTPSLRSLTIKSCPVQVFKSFICPSLTLLELRGGDHSKHFTLDFLLDTLEHLPSLKILKLSLFTPDEMSFRHRLSLVNLPHIEVLEIGASAAFCALILEGILVPLPASLSVSLMLPDIDKSANITLVDRILRKVQDFHLKAKHQHPLQLHLRHTAYRTQDQITVNLRSKVGFKPTGDQSLMAPPLTITLMFHSFTFGERTELVSPCLERVLSLLPLEGVHELIFVGPDEIIGHDPDGTIFLSRLKNVTYLACVASRQSPGRIGKTLQRLTPPVLFPDLQRLDIRNVAHHSIIFGYQLKPVLDQLIVALEARGRRKPGLKSFFVESRKYDKGKVRGLLASLLLRSASPRINLNLDLDVWARIFSESGRKSYPPDDGEDEPGASWLENLG